MAEPWLDGTRAVRTGWVQPPAVSTPQASITAPFCPVKGARRGCCPVPAVPQDGVWPSPMLGFLRAGRCSWRGSGPYGQSSASASLTPSPASQPLLHRAHIGRRAGRRRCARLCLSTTGLSSVSPWDGDRPGFPAGVPGQGAVGAWCPRPSHPSTAAPRAPLGPVPSRTSTDFPVPAPVKLRAPAAKRAVAVPWPCQDHPQATPGVPDREAEGAGTHRGSCAVSATDTWMGPLWPMGHVGSFTPGLPGGSRAGAAGAPNTYPSPTDTHMLPRLRSLLQALLPWEPRGGARSPSLLCWAQCGESQVRHVTNLICSSC